MDEYLTSDAALRQYVDRLADYAIIFLDAEGHIVTWNEGARVMKGYAAEEIVGKHFSILYTPEARDIGHPQRELAAATSVGRYEEEGWRVRKDNSRFWAHVIIHALQDEAGHLCGFAKIVRDFTDQKQAIEQSANAMKLLQFTSYTDYLTGLDNRRSLDQQLASHISVARRHGRPLSLAMLDLDHFKKFNDEFGHVAGDTYLKQATVVWRSCIRPEDLIARYGGEEFVVVCNSTSIGEAAICMERLRAMTPRPLTCSIGLAQWDPDETPHGLIERADRALYEAKQSGRNRIVAAAG